MNDFDFGPVYFWGIMTVWAVGFVTCSVRAHLGRETEPYVGMFALGGMVWPFAVGIALMFGVAYLAHRGIGVFVRIPRPVEVSPELKAALREVEQIAPSDHE